MTDLDECVNKPIRRRIIPSYKIYCERYDIEHRPKTVMPRCADGNCDGFPNNWNSSCYTPLRSIASRLLEESLK